MIGYTEPDFDEIKDYIVRRTISMYARMKNCKPSDQQMVYITAFAKTLACGVVRNEITMNDVSFLVFYYAGELRLMNINTPSNSEDFA